MTDAAPRMRSDARENRDRIVAAARALFAEQGLDVGTREVARRAGVGPATLYRRFPTRGALIDEAFAAEMRACRRIVVEGGSDLDTWRGLSTTVRELVALSTRNRGFVEAVLASPPHTAGLIAHRQELLRLLAGLVRRARDEGVVRPDLVVDDLILVLSAGRGVTGGRGRRGSFAADRLTDLLLDALQAGAMKPDTPTDSGPSTHNRRLVEGESHGQGSGTTCAERFGNDGQRRSLGNGCVQGDADDRSEHE